ncbi:MAG: hypothetical protein NTW30_01790, partial [Candidatus Aenigmarchaeota archaeon]|nr:hypothetical protein [Candidatus Aenigmarchaeota archaeon]
TYNETTEYRKPDNPQNAFDDGFNDTSTYAYFSVNAPVADGDTEAMTYVWDFNNTPSNVNLFYTWTVKLSSSAALIYFYNFGTSQWNTIRTVSSNEAGTYSLLVNSTYINSTGAIKVMFYLGAYDQTSGEIYLNDTYVHPSTIFSCGSLSKDQSCQLNWTINATGNFIAGYKIGVLFNTSYNQNHTDNATIIIIECTEDSDIGWSSIDFGNPQPNTPGSVNSATDNINNLFNITNKGTCTLQVWIKGTDLENTSLQYPNIIGVGNLTWSNVSNSYSNSYTMTTSYVLLNSSFTPSIKNITTYYWLAVPPVYAGRYNGTIYICRNTTQQSGSSGPCME